MTLGCRGKSADPGEAGLPKNCVAVGFGHWAPSDPQWLPPRWRVSMPHFELSPRLASLQVNRDSLRVLQLAPFAEEDPANAKMLAVPGRDVSTRSQLMLDGWRRSDPDSVEFVRYAVLGEGFAVRGRWLGDTMRGRAYSFSDAPMPEEDPRTNAYGVRYPCRDLAAARRAAESIKQWRETDRVDTLTNLREIRAARHKDP